MSITDFQFELEKSLRELELFDLKRICAAVSLRFFPLYKYAHERGKVPFETTPELLRRSLGDIMENPDASPAPPPNTESQFMETIPPIAFPIQVLDALNMKSPEFENEVVEALPFLIYSSLEILIDSLPESRDRFSGDLAGNNSQLFDNYIASHPLTSQERLRCERDLKLLNENVDLNPFDLECRESVIDGFEPVQFEIW